jgi:hypothetical protein
VTPVSMYSTCQLTLQRATPAWSATQSLLHTLPWDDHDLRVFDGKNLGALVTAAPALRFLSFDIGCDWSTGELFGTGLQPLSALAGWLPHSP